MTDADKLAKAVLRDMGCYTMYGPFLHNIAKIIPFPPATWTLTSTHDLGELIGYYYEHSMLILRNKEFNSAVNVCNHQFVGVHTIHRRTIDFSDNILDSFVTSVEWPT